MINDIDAWGNDAATRADYEWAQAEARLDALDFDRMAAAERMMDMAPPDYNWESLQEMIDNMEDEHGK